MPLSHAIRTRPGSRRARPNPAAAAVLAMLLAIAGALLPAAAPALPLPTALVPPTALAADDIAISTATRYTVDPDAGTVRVVVDITAVNEKANQVTGGGVTRYFYDGVNLGVQPEARGLRATQDGSAVRVRAAKRDGYRLVTILFRENIYFGETARLRLTFDLPGGRPRSDSDVRVGSAFATFTAWAFGDAGRVRVEVPGGFRVDIAGEDMDEEPGADGLQAWSARTGDPLAWYAWVNATNEDGLTSDRLDLEGGEGIVIRAWPEDDRWRARVRVLLRDGVPDLVERIGLPWPVEGSLVVTEVHTPLLEGYAGFYDPKTDRITISEDLDDLTIVHEASHAWFNGALFTERWITEGLADEYAARALRADDRGHPGPDKVSPRDTGAFPLNEWAPPAAIRDEEAGDREQYGYAAAWTILRRIVARVGEPGMREVFASAAAGTTAYPGEGEPEDSRLPNDWRRFLDLAEQASDPNPPDEGERSLADLVARWALTPSEATLLPLRAAALEAYAPLVADGGAWAAPETVRLGLDAWDFADTLDAIDVAATVLATRDAIATLAGSASLTPDPGLEAAYEDAGSEAELNVLAEEAAASLAALEAIARASDAAAVPRDPITEWGLDGEDPAAGVAAAGESWEAGELEAAETAAAGVLAELAAAPEAGRTKAMIAGAGTAGGLLLLLLAAALLVRRRRSSAARPPHAVATGGPGPAGAAWPYATLPPDAPPSEPIGGPTSRDEGADRS